MLNSPNRVISSYLIGSRFKCNAICSFSAVLSKLCISKMDRAGIAVLLVLSAALVRVGDSHKVTAGGRKGSADAERGFWDQQLSRVRNQDHSPRGSEPSDETRTLVRLPRGTSSHADDRHRTGPVHAAGDRSAARKDAALRVARQSASQQHRARARQSSKPIPANTRRLAAG